MRDPITVGRRRTAGSADLCHIGFMSTFSGTPSQIEQMNWRAKRVQRAQIAGGLMFAAAVVLLLVLR